MKRGRRDHDWHRDGLTEDHRGHIAFPHARENAVIKLQPFPTVSVLPQRNLIQRTAFKVITNILRKLAARGPRVISHVKERLGIHLSLFLQSAQGAIGQTRLSGANLEAPAETISLTLAPTLPSSSIRLESVGVSWRPCFPPGARETTFPGSAASAVIVGATRPAQAARH